MLRLQHDGALKLATKILSDTARFSYSSDRVAAAAITMTLAKLTGLLKIHFAQEDKSLYPALMASGRGGVAEVARRFFEEMGHIGPAYAAFAETWATPDAILADPESFRTAATAVFTILAERITRENKELYPLADAEHTDPDARHAA